MSTLSHETMTKPGNKLPVYEYEQEPIWDVNQWIAQSAYYVTDPALTSTEQAAYWPHCEKVTYTHTYQQTGNVSDRKQRLEITVTFTLLADGSHDFLILSKYGSSTLFEIASIRAKIVGDKCRIEYQLVRPLKPSEVEQYRPGDVRP